MNKKVNQDCFLEERNNMKFYKYLNEKTYAISGDVDLIYNKFFKKYVKLYHKDIQKFLQELEKDKLNDEYFFGDMMSHWLKSRIAKKATEITPIIIRCGVLKKGNMYDIRHGLISLSLNIELIDLLKQYKGNTGEILKLIPKATTRIRFKNEMTETNIKGSIYHELSHWLNDTLHDENVRKENMKLHIDKKKMEKIGDVTFTDFELDAQVHALKQLHRTHKKVWDQLTWMDIANLKTSFSAVFIKLKSVNKGIREDYRKRLLKRLNREKLIGRNMGTSFYDTIRDI